MPSFRIDLELNGQIQSRTFQTSSVTIGRDPASDLYLEHPTVSRQHALIAEHPNGYSLVVLSANGLTGVNGTKVEKTVELQDGMRLQFGEFLATFHTQHGGSAATIPFGPVAPSGMLQDGPTQPGVSAHPGPVVIGGGVLHNAPTAAIPVIGAGFPAGQGHAPAQPHVTGPIANAHTSHGIVSWDDIAKQAHQEDPQEKVETNFERIKAANAKNKKGGIPPVVYVLLVVAIVGVLASPMLAGNGDDDIDTTSQEVAEELVYLPTDFDCLKPDGCLKEADEKYRIGIENLKKKQADVGNLFRGYMNLDMADRFVQASGKERPKQMADLDEKRKAALEELKVIEQNYQVQFHRSFQRRNYEDMYAAIVAMRAQFPDKRSRVYRDADDKEMMMKENAILPKKKK